LIEQTKSKIVPWKMQHETMQHPAACSSHLGGAGDQKVIQKLSCVTFWQFGAKIQIYKISDGAAGLGALF
jgi:hypothetical protein